MGHPTEVLLLWAIFPLVGKIARDVKEISYVVHIETQVPCTHISFGVVSTRHAHGDILLEVVAIFAQYCFFSLIGPYNNFVISMWHGS